MSMTLKGGEDFSEEWVLVLVGVEVKVVSCFLATSSFFGFWRNGIPAIRKLGNRRVGCIEFRSAWHVKSGLELRELTIDLSIQIKTRPSDLEPLDQLRKKILALTLVISCTVKD
jgi:hypothetical protein